MEIKDILKFDDWRIGDIVFYYEHWSKCMIKAKIEKIIVKGDNSRSVLLNDICTVDTDGNEITKRYGNLCKSSNDVFSSCKEAYECIFNKRNKIVNEYCNLIKTVQDLMKFPLEHCFCGEEYTDDEAIEAYKIRAKELLNIEC